MTGQLCVFFEGFNCILVDLMICLIRTKGLCARVTKKMDEQQQKVGENVSNTSLGK